MGDLFIPLRLTHGVNGVYLHSLRGADEMLVEDGSTRTALLLLEKLMKSEVSSQKSENTGSSDIRHLTSDLRPPTSDFRVADIVTADRDRIFAALYINLYGSKIESTITCRHCNTPFDLDFSLRSLLDHYQLSSTPANDNGVFQLGNNTRFRLPTGADELLLSEISETTAEDFLLSRCLIEGDVKKNGELVQEKMAELAPVLNLNMQAHCPGCETNQEVQFDIQTFFLTRLKQENTQLIKEVHRLAKVYHWSAADILNLPRNQRKQYVAMIESEL